MASLMVTLIDIAGSYYLQGILDEYIPNQLISTLGIISIGLIITYIIQQMMEFAKGYLLVVLSQRLVIDVILSYIRHIFTLPMSFFATRRTGEITSRFSDANSIIDAVASTIFSIFLDLTAYFSRQCPIDTKWQPFPAYTHFDSYLCSDYLCFHETF